MPVSKVYVGVSPIAYMNLSMRSSLALNDLFQQREGKFITALYDQDSRDKFLKSIKHSGNRFLLDANTNTNLLSFGFRIKDKNYFHFNVSEHLDVAGYLPHDMFEMLFDKGMDNFEGTNSFKFSRAGLNGCMYTAIALGYTRIVNDKWTVGGKFKVLLGHTYRGVKISSLDLKTSYKNWNLDGKGDLIVAGASEESSLPYYVDDSNIKDVLQPQIDLSTLFKPHGTGLAVDMGAVYRPFKLLKTSFAITDLGFISWKKNARKYACTLQGKYDGLQDQIDMEAMWETLQDIGENMFSSTIAETRFRKMVRAKLNVGADLMLANDKIDIGLYSKTDFWGKFISEEVTFGTAFRPANWFNFALTYSFVGANWNCLGAGLTLMPKDGVQLMLAMDYIPLTYAKTDGISIPYKMSNFDLSLGFSIVIGSNPKKKKEEEQKPPQIEPEKEKKHRKAKNENEDPHLTQKDRNWKKKKNW